MDEPWTVYDRAILLGIWLTQSNKIVQKAPTKRGLGHVEKDCQPFLPGSQLKAAGLTMRR